MRFLLLDAVASSFASYPRAIVFVPPPPVLVRLLTQTPVPVIVVFLFYSTASWCSDFLAACLVPCFFLVRFVQRISIMLFKTRASVCVCV